MKVAISSTGKDLNAMVDPRFGRADYLLIVDTDNLMVGEIIDNRDAHEAAQGAGINAASRIARAGATAILTGYVGPKAAAVCEKAGVQIVNDMSGTVRQAVEYYKQISQQPEKKKESAEETGSQRPAIGGGRGVGKAGIGMGRGGCGRGGQGRGRGNRGR